MSAMQVAVGNSASFAKTVTDADVVLFAGLSGDFYAAHVNEQVMAKTPYGRRIAHGALLVAFMSAASTALIHKLQAQGDGTTPVSLGYDRMRFVAPVFIGDTVTVNYVVSQVDRERRRSIASIDVANQRGERVAVAEHVMKWLPAVDEEVSKK